jgi:hypothetical protein
MLIGPLSELPLRQSKKKACMTSERTAAGHPAGAGPLHAQIPQLVALVGTGALALDLWRAEQAVVELHGIYVGKLRQYEGRHGSITGALSPRNHEHIAIIAYTMDVKQALMAARRKVYSARRRLRAACAKAAREGASTA